MKDFNLELEKEILEELRTPYSNNFYTTISLENRDRKEVAKILEYHGKKFCMYKTTANILLRDKLKRQDLYWAGATYIPFGVLIFLLSIPIGFLFKLLSWTFVFNTVLWIIVGYYIFNGIYAIQLIMEYKRLMGGKFKE